MGANLIHAYEIGTRPWRSSNSAPTVVLDNQIAFNPAWFDGATYYFEVNANNADSASRGISLIDLTNGNQVLATCTVPGNTNTATRYRSNAFSPNSGTNTLAISLDQTTTASNLWATTSRIIIAQVDATKTRLQYEFLTRETHSTASPPSATKTTTSITYTGADGTRSGYFNKNSALYATLDSNPWTFEAVLGSSDASGIAYLELYNVTDSASVTGSELSVTGTTLTLTSVALSDTATNLHDGDRFYTRIKSNNASYTASVYRAALYVSLTPVTLGQVFWRIGRYYEDTAGVNPQRHRAKIDTNSYSNPVTYWEATGRCADNAPVLYLCTDSTNDSGNANQVELGSKNWNSTTLTTWRSNAIANITDGFRVQCYNAASTAASVCTEVFLVIAFSAPPATQFFPQMRTHYIGLGLKGGI